MTDRTEEVIDSRWENNYQEWFLRAQQIDIVKLLRADAPEYNFNEISPQVRTVLGALKELSQNYDFWSFLPEYHRSNMATKIAQVLAILDEIKDFNPEQDNAWSQRTSLVQRFNSEYRELYDYLIEKLHAYLGNRAYTKELDTDFGKQAKKELNEIRTIKADIDEVRQSVKDAASIASDTASTATAQFFDEDAKGHNTVASRWFWGVVASFIIVGVVTLLFTLSIIKELTGKPDNINATYVTVKLVIIGVTLLALRFTTKNYNANMHLAVVNKHRANVLKSVEAHRTTAVDGATKDAVLAAGVAAAFSQAETGFISTKEGAGSDTIDPTSYLKDIVPRGDK